MVGPASPAEASDRIRHARRDLAGTNKLSDSELCLYRACYDSSVESARPSVVSGPAWPSKGVGPDIGCSADETRGLTCQ